VIQIRKLAAVDLAHLGPRLILAEFGLGILGPAALGILSVVRSHSLGGTLFGLYLIALALNYVPLLLHAISLVRGGTAQVEIAAEAGDRKRLFQKYRRQSVWLLVPLVVPIVAVAQEWRMRWNSHS